MQLTRATAKTTVRIFQSYQNLQAAEISQASARAHNFGGFAADFVVLLPNMLGTVRTTRRISMKNWLCLIGLTVGMAACGGAKAPDNTAATETTPNNSAAPPETASSPAASSAAAVPAERFTELTIPAGTTLRLALSSSVASDTSTVEQPVRATLRSPVSINGHVALPQGSEIGGVVTEAQGSGRIKGRARLALRFNSVKANGESYDIRTSGYAQEAAATKKQDAEKIAIGAGAGAALGAILGGGGGAAKGAAIGGAGGTGVVLATKGKEVRLGPGAAITTKLTAPLTVRVRS
jgi:hypothetical protein